MRFTLSILISISLSMVACSQDNYSEEVTPEIEVINDEDPQASPGDRDPDAVANPPSNLNFSDANLQKAYDAFVAKGVPKTALTRAFEFYRNNRASTGGLLDTSCLIKPMSETGEIPKDSNRWDSTTLAMLKTGIRNERYIMIVDFTQSNNSKRGYLLDLEADANGNYPVVTMQISHGYGSNAVNGIPQVFTNLSGKGTTVSGFFVTAAMTYKYYGNAASTGSYTSTGLRLYGLESTNNTAEKTSKVSHGAPYVSDTRAGNSAGCPAMTTPNSGKYLPLLKGGILWYHHTKINNSLTYKAPSC